MCNRHSTVAEKAYAEKSCLFPNHDPTKLENLQTTCKYPKKQKQRHFKTRNGMRVDTSPIHINAK